MKIICDFHLHSKYSRATSRDMDLDNLAKWAKIKGIKVLGTGDFTHPLWLKEIKEKLEPLGSGLYKIKNQSAGWRTKVKNSEYGISENRINFILTSEISCIYSKNGKTRKIHILVFAPDLQTVEKINTHLGWIGNLKADGRPILGLDAKELTKIVLNINPDCLIIPAHAWTPWFSVFGSKSGFDSIEECFEEYSKHIHSIETGLSSDSAMNWRVSALDKITLISNSDAHSPSRIGRESNVFEIAPSQISYQEIVSIIKEKDLNKFLYTIEFFPEDGKYHYDGHRLCKISLSPEESKKHKNICPKCGKPLTIGVMARVEELADRPVGTKPENPVPFKNLIPLEEIIADTLSQGVGTKAVREHYRSLINKLGSEFNILLDASRFSIEEASTPEIAEGVIRVREGRVKVEPGYDGEYGKIKIFEKGEQKTLSKQTSLF